MESAVLEFWRDYLDSLPPDLDQEPKLSGVFSFGDSKKLAGLVRQGIKTATCSAISLADLRSKKDKGETVERLASGEGFSDG